MGYVFSFKDAAEYEKALSRPQFRFALDLQREFFLNMLKPAPGETALDIGCGTGEHMTSLVEAGVSVTGIDPSPYMLDIARGKIKNRASFQRGFAESLPFEDNSFNHACLITTLEFAENPDRALEEACRVARDRLFVGYLNRYSLLGSWRRVSGIFHSSIYNHARFYSAWDLKKRIRRFMGDVPFCCRTIGQIPAGRSDIIRRGEASHIAQAFPFGAFGGLTAVLVPRYKTRPLAIPLPPKRRQSPAAG
ncbi:Methyltransferase type 11 [Candidatus Desulfarcum epimagneticum]|uniref:Methyltransferase type 11 n=1 Tax=uncultured Desulfobacteraceae bacterium TaxID=218296 RepID=A0A484HGN8_9BACT|nr:Methyltransferase type 11 [uncultured Desulfobacteraceae bacterium]